MDFIQSQNRSQVSFGSLEDHITTDNPVRLIDAFVEQVDLKRLGFRLAILKKEGRPAFASTLFLKLYFYGYMNGLRIGRTLESEFTRNTELQWLLGGLKPNYHSITDFRKVNPKALRNTFKLLSCFSKKQRSLVMRFLLEKLKSWKPDCERIVRAFLRNELIRSNLSTCFFRLRILMANY